MNAKTSARDLHYLQVHRATKLECITSEPLLSVQQTIVCSADYCLFSRPQLGTQGVHIYTTGDIVQENPQTHIHLHKQSSLSIIGHMVWGQKYWKSPQISNILHWHRSLPLNFSSHGLSSPNCSILNPPHTMWTKLIRYWSISVARVPIFPWPGTPLTHSENGTRQFPGARTTSLHY